MTTRRTTTRPAVEMETVEKLPGRRGPVAGVAAAVLVLFVGLGSWAYLGSTPDGLTAASAPEEFGRAMVAAFDQHDAKAASALLGSDPEIRAFGSTTPEEFARLFEWFEAIDLRFESQGCISYVSGTATCSVLQSNRWNDAIGAGPATAELRISVAEGAITHIAYDSFFNWNSVFNGFFHFLRANHPSDIDRMWRINLYGGVDGPELTDEAFTLFERYTAEYAQRTAIEG